jgi:2-haloacid dehalogenase
MFGTLADTSSVADELEALCGDRAPAVARIWRARQLEYMFRATAMGQFPTFADLTTWGLTRALNECGIAVPPRPRLTDLANGYRRLQPFDDVRSSLAGLRSQGHRIAVFSVGPRAWLKDLVATYDNFVDDLVSAEDAGVYKPHPGIYRYLLVRTGTESSSTAVVSSNPFDIIGASSVGLRTVWCKRDPLALFDPWGPRPDHTVPSLSALAEILTGVGHPQSHE